MLYRFAKILAAAAAALALTAGANAAEPAFDASAVDSDVVIGTAATSGMYYFVGAAVGNAVGSASNMHVLVESTNGSMENIAYAVSGDIDIGMGNADALYAAYNGEQSYAEVGKQDIRQIATLYGSVVHMYTRADSGITSWKDLKGKKVSLGASGTTHVYFCQQILQRYGINWETDVEAYYMDTGEGAEKLSDGDIDAAFLIGGPPLAGIEGQLATTDFRFLSLDQDVIDKMLADFPYFSRSTMKAGTYSGQDYDVATIGLMTCFFASAELADETAYSFVKYMMESLPTYKDTNTATREISPETVAEYFIPLHPGAEAYYKEMGWLK